LSQVRFRQLNQFHRIESMHQNSRTALIHPTDE